MYFFCYTHVNSLLIAIFGVFMKYKYIVGLFVALGFSNAFAADEEPIAKDNYQAMYEAFRCSSVKDINDALQNNQTFNHKNDTDIIRSSQTGLALRKAVIGLNADQLQAVVEKNHEFFKTSLGTSLIYGWTLNQFKEPVTPYYIGDYFSFDKLFQGLASKMVDHNVATFLKSAFTLGLSAVEADRWAFYDHMLYLPYAIEQVGIIGTSDLSIDDVIRMSRCTKEEAQAERQAAAHLDEIQDAYVIVEEDFLERSFANKTTNLVRDEEQSTAASFDETDDKAASEVTLLNIDEEYVFADSSISSITSLKVKETNSPEKYFDKKQSFVTKKFISVYAVIITLVS